MHLNIELPDALAAVLTAQAQIQGLIRAPGAGDDGGYLGLGKQYLESLTHGRSKSCCLPE